MRPFCIKRPWDEGAKKIIEECLCEELVEKKTILTPHRERLNTILLICKFLDF